MRITERDPQQRQLMTLYVPSEPGRVMPSEVSDEIVLTHPAQPFSSQLAATQLISIVGVNGVTAVEAPPPAAGAYHYIHAFSADHNDPMAREVRLQLFRSGVLGVELAFNVALAQDTFLPCPRAFLIPGPDWFLRVVIGSIAAGSRLQFRAIQTPYLFPEICPQL